MQLFAVAAVFAAFGCCCCFCSFLLLFLLFLLLSAVVAVVVAGVAATDLAVLEIRFAPAFADFCRNFVAAVFAALFSLIRIIAFC